MQTTSLSVVLGGTWFGAALPVTARARLAAVASLVDLAPGTTVLEEGRPATAMGVIVAGRLALRLHVPGLGERTILTLEPGDVFGWSAVLPGAVATATCVAVAPSAAVMFDGFGLMAALETDKELAAAVYRTLVGVASRRLAATRIQLLDLYRVAGEPW